MKPLLFLFLIPAIFVAWVFVVLDSDNKTPPLDPKVFTSKDCSYLGAETLNTIFDERPVGSDYKNAAPRDDWEFNIPGVWREDASDCIWKSSNIEGLSVVVKAKKFAVKTLDDGTLFPPFVKGVDDFGSISTRIDCFRPADKAAILGTSNYGEGGIAMIWSLYSIHVHVIADQETDLNNIQIRIDTELEAEWILGQHILLRLEAFREIVPSLIQASGQKDKC